jgi:perosamine synthetase
MKAFIEFVREIYRTNDVIPLHEPRFIGNEKQYVNDCIDSTFVSSVGKYVNRFEMEFAKLMDTQFAIATVNGTAALHTVLMLNGASSNTEILTQPITFVATLNAISYTGATPVFIDVDRSTLSISPEKLAYFLQQNGRISDEGLTFNKLTGKRILACIPVHTFGHPAKLDLLQEICDRYGITLIEDAAESIGSRYKDRHTGSFGLCGIFSFNGNKTITTGGGGMIITDNEDLARKAKHITTTAKIPHKWEYIHDEIGFNYRLPNLNAALGCAQLENLHKFITAKRKLAALYLNFFKNYPDIEFFTEPPDAFSNYWLNTIIMKDIKSRDRFLENTNHHGITTRPVWRLMNHLSMYNKVWNDGLVNSNWLEERIVNLPSSVILDHE